MAKLVDIISILMLILAAVAFSAGIQALAEERDLAALYWLVVGGLLLRSSTDILRPAPGGR